MAALTAERGPLPPHSELLGLPVESGDPVLLGGRDTLSVGGRTLGKRTSSKEELTFDGVQCISGLSTQLCPLTTDVSVVTHVQDHIDTQGYTDVQNCKALSKLCVLSEVWVPLQ